MQTEGTIALRFVVVHSYTHRWQRMPGNKKNIHILPESAIAKVLI